MVRAPHRSSFSVLGSLFFVLGSSFALATEVAGAFDTHVRIVPLPPGRSISLDVTIGTVQIVGSSRTDAMIEIVRRAPAEAGLSRIPIDIAEADGAIRIHALQADGRTDPDYRSDVTLHVPVEAQLAGIRVMEGRITLHRLHGTVSADIRRGSISGRDLAGVVRLESGIGDVRVEGAVLSEGGLLRLRAFNGDVQLSLADRPRDARILALALNGTIASEIPLTMKDTWGPRWGEATLGRGEPVISIDVVTGRIEIKAP